MHTKLIAESSDIWDLVDPDGEEPKPLTEPKIPTPADARILEPTKSEGVESLTISELVEEDLTAVERDRLKWMRKQYSIQRQEYKDKKKGLLKFRTHLLSTVPPVYTSTALRLPTLYNSMVFIRNRLAPIEENFRTLYQELQKPPQDLNLELWIAQWESLVPRLREGDTMIDLRLHPEADFITANESVDKSFATVMFVNRKAYPSFEMLAESFRHHYRIRPPGNKYIV